MSKLQRGMVLLVLLGVALSLCGVACLRNRFDNENDDMGYEDDFGPERR